MQRYTILIVILSVICALALPAHAKGIVSVEILRPGSDTACLANSFEQFHYLTAGAVFSSPATSVTADSEHFVIRILFGYDGEVFGADELYYYTDAPGYLHAPDEGSKGRWYLIGGNVDRDLRTFLQDPCQTAIGYPALGKNE
jgi:hypothetical protein